MRLLINEHIEQFNLDKELERVGQQRGEYAMRFHKTEDRKLAIAAFRLLQQALLEDYGITEIPSFIYNRFGKPSITGHPNIHFNLSHCHTGAACAIDDNPIGVDIETFDNYDIDIISQVMNSEEQNAIATSRCPDVEFIRLWTMKESLLKLRGCGITEDLRCVLQNADYNFKSIITDKYVCTICSKQPVEQVKVSFHE